LREVTLEGRQFVVGNLDPLRAFHVVRKLAPLVGTLREFIPYIVGVEALDQNDLDTMARLAEPIARALAEMPEEDANYVIFTTLSAIQVKLPEQGNVLAPLTAGTAFMFDWITMPLMIRLVIQGVLENTRDFMPAGALAS
jgi:tail assembly chaperone